MKATVAVLAVAMAVSEAYGAACTKIEYNDARNWPLEKAEKEYCLSKYRTEIGQSLSRDLRAKGLLSQRDSEAIVADVSGCADRQAMLGRVIENMHKRALPACKSASAETVDVKYRGPVNLAPFACDSIDRSSLVMRLCYDAKERYVIVKLQSTYYHYCEVPSTVVSAWKVADSMGKFFNANIKGQYDCRINRVPPYGK